jgi:hypothetical protein
VFGAAPAGARTPPAFHSVSTAVNAPGDAGGPPLLGDGGRYVFWVASDGASTVLDARTGKRKTGLMPTGCRPEALGSGLLVYACDRADPPEKVVDLATGQTREIEGLADFRSAADEPPRIVGVGRQWVSADVFFTTPGRYKRWYLNWHSGRVVSEAITGREIQNLDTRQLAQPMCAPFRRPPEDIDVRFDDLAYQYRAPYGIRVGAPRSDDVVLSRCGSRRRVVLARARGFVPEPGLMRSGIVTWTAEKGIGAYVLRSHRLFRWSGVPAALTHAGDYVFRAVARADSRWTIQRARVRP